MYGDIPPLSPYVFISQCLSRTKHNLSIFVLLSFPIQIMKIWKSVYLWLINTEN
jgi:hypothetical protein